MPRPVQPEPEAQPKPVTPPAPAAPPAFTFAFRGFISGGVYVQDGLLSAQGMGPLFATAKPASDKVFFTGDIRQTRLNFSMKGPTVLGSATPTGVVEVDFFGGQTAGAFGDDSVFPRIRLAYVEAAWKNTTLRVGQFHNLVIGFLPASAGHIAFPYAYGSGLLGWRSPGVTLLQKVPMGGMNLELGVQANRNNWNDTVATCSATVTPPNCLPGGIPLGEASGLPQVQARLALSSGKAPSPWPLYPSVDWMVFIAGNYDQKDVNGFGAPAGESFTTVAGQGGAKAQVGPLHLAVHGWVGQNTGNMLGHIVQFNAPLLPTAGNANLQDVFGWGAWAQAGFNMTKELSLWGYVGTDRPDEEDARAAGFTRVEQNVLSAMLAYKDGPYAAGLEWVHWATTPAPTAAVADPDAVNVNQVGATVTYFF